jgi:hypothetical protein
MNIAATTTKTIVITGPTTIAGCIHSTSVFTSPTPARINSR